MRVCLFVCWVWLFECLFVQLLACLRVCLYVCLCMIVCVCPFVCVFDCALVGLDIEETFVSSRGALARAHLRCERSVRDYTEIHRVDAPTHQPWQQRGVVHVPRTLPPAGRHTPPLPAAHIWPGCTRSSRTPLSR